MTIYFGPSGKPDDFYQQCNSSIDIPQWLYNKGLTAYEYSFTKGVKIGQSKAEEIGENASKYNIKLSIHAPYSINLSHNDIEIRKKSIDNLMRAITAASWMQADRVVFHPGNVTNEGNEIDFKRTYDCMKEIIDKVYKHGYDRISLCPETMGQLRQVGTLDEIILLTNLDKIVLPTIDFGHIHARYGGILNNEEDFQRTIDFLINNIEEKSKQNNFHIHFSKVEFGKKGEKRHISYHDRSYGPDFIHLAKVIIKRNLSARIICESRKTMLEDALQLKSIYMEILNSI